jgi:hypothetical protein
LSPATYGSSDGVPRGVWYTNVVQQSADCTVNALGTGIAPAEFTLSTSGVYKVTVTGQIRTATYPSGTLPSNPMLYGINIPAAIAGFEISSHTMSPPSTSWPATGDQNQLQWTDTFYVNAGVGTVFTVLLYCNINGAAINTIPGCVVSVLRTTGPQLF